MKIEFYHSFILHDGRRFEGQWDLNPTTPCLDKIAVAGKTVLDLACRDGWYSYQFERMGAGRVMGLDIDDRQARRFTHEAYGSKVGFIHSNAYSLRSSPEKQFDVVFAGDILCHVDNPLGLMKVAHHAARERFYFVADVSPSMEVWDRYYIWKFTEKALIGLAKIAGFGDIRVLDRYQITGSFWKHQNQKSLIRQVVLVSCARDQEWKLDMNDEAIIPVEKSINYRPELTVEVGEIC